MTATTAPAPLRPGDWDRMSWHQRQRRARLDLAWENTHHDRDVTYTPELEAERFTIPAPPDPFRAHTLPDKARHAMTLIVALLDRELTDTAKANAAAGRAKSKTAAA